MKVCSSRRDGSVWVGSARLHETSRRTTACAIRVPFCSGYAGLSRASRPAARCSHTETPANARSGYGTRPRQGHEEPDRIIRGDAMSAETPNPEYACLQGLPDGQADAGTRTPDPIIARYAMRARDGSWLSQIRSRNHLCVPRVCHPVASMSRAGGLSEIKSISDGRCYRLRHDETRGAGDYDGSGRHPGRAQGRRG
jgi:hypothetical protein